MMRLVRRGQLVGISMRLLTPVSVSIVAAANMEASAEPASRLDVLRLDAAHYDPVSLGLRRLQWVEQEFAPDCRRINWDIDQSLYLACSVVVLGGHSAEVRDELRVPIPRAHSRNDLRLLALRKPLPRSPAQTHG